MKTLSICDRPLLKPLCSLFSRGSHITLVLLAMILAYLLYSSLLLKEYIPFYKNIYVADCSL
jgi:hypothetical protein